MKTLSILLLLASSAMAQTYCQNGVCYQVVTPTKQVQTYVPTVEPQSTVTVQPQVVYTQPQSVVVQSTPTAAPCPKCGKYHGATSTQSTQQYATQGGGGAALANANAQRARRGLPPFRWDPRLQANVNESVRRQAARGRMFHAGQGMQGAVGEGVGMSGSAESFTSCYLTGSHQTAAAASMQGRNGRWFHALQVSGPGSWGGGGVRGSRRRFFRR